MFEFEFVVDGVGIVNSCSLRSNRRIILRAFVAIALYFYYSFDDMARWKPTLIEQDQDNRPKTKQQRKNEMEKKSCRGWATRGEKGVRRG